MKRARKLAKKEESDTDDEKPVKKKVRGGVKKEEDVLHYGNVELEPVKKSNNKKGVKKEEPANGDSTRNIKSEEISAKPVKNVKRQKMVKKGTDVDSEMGDNLEDNGAVVHTVAPKPRSRVKKEVSDDTELDTIPAQPKSSTRAGKNIKRERDDDATQPGRLSKSESEEEFTDIKDERSEVKTVSRKKGRKAAPRFVTRIASRYSILTLTYSAATAPKSTRRTRSKA